MSMTEAKNFEGNELYKSHQDHLGLTAAICRTGLCNCFHPHNKSALGHGAFKQDGLLFLYKESRDGHILPTTVGKTPTNFSDHDQITYSREELGELKKQGLMYCVPMLESDTLVLNNRTGIHATTNYDGVEVLLGQGEGSKYFNPESPDELTPDIKETPIFRITASTYFSEGE